jgi:hypothetical protein
MATPSNICCLVAAEYTAVVPVLPV